MTKLITSLLFLCSALVHAADLEMKCMEMIQGFASEKTTYRFIQKSGALTSSRYTEGPLSTFKETKLGHTSSKLGGSTSYSVHTWVKEGKVLKRTVRHVPDEGSKEKERSFHTIYDFRRQVILDDEKIDSCRHSNRK